MIRKIRRFMQGRRGQGMSEYIIMVGLVAIAAIGIYSAFGDQIQRAMAAIGKQLAGETGSTQEADSDLDDKSDLGATLKDFGSGGGGSGDSGGQ